MHQKVKSWIREPFRRQKDHVDVIPTVKEEEEIIDVEEYNEETEMQEFISYDSTIVSNTTQAQDEEHLFGEFGHNNAIRRSSLSRSIQETKTVNRPTKAKTRKKRRSKSIGEDAMSRMRYDSSNVMKGRRRASTIDVDCKPKNSFGQRRRASTIDSQDISSTLFQMDFIPRTRVDKLIALNPIEMFDEIRPSSIHTPLDHSDEELSNSLSDIEVISVESKEKPGRRDSFVSVNSNLIAGQSPRRRSQTLDSDITVLGEPTTNATDYSTHTHTRAVQPARLRRMSSTRDEIGLLDLSVAKPGFKKTRRSSMKIGLIIYLPFLPFKLLNE